MSISIQKDTSILATNNSHPRDFNIKFYTQGHKYEIQTDPSAKYTSVTTFCHSHFPKFNADAIIKSMMNGKNWVPGHKYWGLTAEAIKALWANNGSKEGTKLHSEIEYFMNHPLLTYPYTHKELLEQYILHPKEIEAVEWTYFIQFIKDHPDLKPYRTEWLIFDEDLKIAGSIDMIYENADGTLSIYDWKRCKEITKVNQWNKYAITKSISHLHDSNFWHYALQLNTYKAILERKYGKIVKELFLVQLHPESTEPSYEVVSIPFLLKEIEDLFSPRLPNKNM